MDRTERYRALIKELLTEVAEYTPPTENIRTDICFDDERGHYQIYYIGWENDERILDVIMHMDLIDGKIWVQENATDIGLNEIFFRSGVLYEDIVYGTEPPYVRERMRMVAA